MGRNARRRHFIKDRGHVFFEIGDIRPVLVALITAAEEVRRRQLFWINQDDGLPAAGNRADRMPGRDLRGIIEEPQIKPGLTGRQLLRHRQRRHQHTGGRVW